MSLSNDQRHFRVGHLADLGVLANVSFAKSGHSIATLCEFGLPVVLCPSVVDGSHETQRSYRVGALARDQPFVGRHRPTPARPAEGKPSTS